MKAQTEKTIKWILGTLYLLLISYGLYIFIVKYWIET